MVTLKKHRRHRPEFQHLSGNQEEQLLTGIPFIAHSDEFASLEDLQAAWEIHRDRLREEWRAGHAPGSRCFAEWLFELVPAVFLPTLLDSHHLTAPDAASVRKTGLFP